MSTKYSASPEGHLSWREFVSDSNISISVQEPVHCKATKMVPKLQIKTALFPDLTLFRHIASCLLQQKLWSSKRTTSNQQNSVLFTKSRWIPKCINCNKLSHQQAVHISSLFASTKDVLDLCQHV
jgi:hypothetical protein